MKIHTIISGIKKISLKTLYINFKYLPLKQAILLPIWISHKCYLLKVSGKIDIGGKITTGMIQIGYGEVGIFDRKRSRSVFELEGKIIFKGRAFIGQGCKLSITNKGILELGHNFVITAETAIVCHKGINIGNDCLISWDVLIMDTDIHKIMNNDNIVINPPKQIKIGDRVWIGCRSIVLKGVEISSGTIIAANSTITKSQTTSNTLVGGNPTQILRTDVTWSI